MPPLRAPRSLGHPRHDDEQLGDDAVGRPQLHAVRGRSRRRPRSAPRCSPCRAGSEPTSGSVSRKARDGARGRSAAGTSRFCSSVPNMLQRLRDADRLVRRQQRAERGWRSRRGPAPGCSTPGRGRGRRTPRGSSSRARRVPSGRGSPRPGCAPRARSPPRRLGHAGSRAAGRGTPRPSRTASGVGRGCGWIRSSRKRPRKSSLAKLGLRQSLSRASSCDLAGFALGDLACCGGCGHGCVTSGGGPTGCRPVLLVRTTRIPMMPPKKYRRASDLGSAADVRADPAMGPGRAATARIRPRFGRGAPPRGARGRPRPRSGSPRGRGRSGRGPARTCSPPSRT